MDRPDPSDQPTIFSRPDPGLEDDQTVSQPANEIQDADQASVVEPESPTIEDQPVPAGHDPLFPRGVPRGERRGLSRNMLLLIGGGAVLLAAAGGFAGFLLFSPDEPPVVGALPTQSDAPSLTAGPTVAATPELSATPEPTPEPTPTGPPVELAVGDWATVTAAELEVRAGAGEDQDSTYTLVRGAVLTVAEGPQTVDGANWYRVASLGGASGWVPSGWIANPSLETILNDPVLIRCGEVADPVFDIVDGAPVPREVLRVGDFAVPSNKLNTETLATIELARGIRAEVCVTAQVGANGLPTLSSEPQVTACGHAVADGQTFWLRPAAGQEVEVTYQIKDKAVVHPALLAGPADQRQSSNPRALLTMMSYEGASGCIAGNINVDEDGVQSYRSMSTEQCSIVSEYNDLNLKLRPAAGGTTTWIKLPKDGSRSSDIPLNVAIDVYMSTQVGPDGISSYAWTSYGYEREECA